MRFKQTNNSLTEKSGAHISNARAAFGVALLLMLLTTATTQTTTAQQQTPTPTPQQQTAVPTTADDEDEDEESESIDLRNNVATRPRAIDPSTILRTARTVFVHSKTAFVKDSEVENALRKRSEFQAWGMIITRDEGQADLIVEVERKAFTKRFVFTVVDPKTLTVVLSGKARSIIFGKSIAHKVAEKFVNRMKPARQQ